MIVSDPGRKNNRLVKRKNYHKCLARLFSEKSQVLNVISIFMKNALLYFGFFQCYFSLENTRKMTFITQKTNKRCKKNMSLHEPRIN